MSETKERPKLSDPRPPAILRPIDQIRRQLEKMSAEFEVALPQHIPVDRFKRVAITAINQNPELLGADRKSLFAACMRAAQDGLLPDGREGAFVVYKNKVKNEETGKDSWIPSVQWMPMVYGIIKKLRQGQIIKVTAYEVYERDEFEYLLGDDESIYHKPYVGKDAPGEVIAAYAVATFKDGHVERRVMPRWQIDKVRQASKAPNSPAWVNWFGEMSCKAVLRRLSKYLPMPTELEDMLNRADIAAAVADTVAAKPDDGMIIDGDLDDDGVIDTGAAPADDAGQTDQADQGQAAIAHDQTPKVTVPEAEAREMEMIDRGEPVPQQEQVQVQQTAEVKTPKKSQGKFF
jgi:phage RecT family recombinase